jgi:uncharacterized protein YraI
MRRSLPLLLALTLIAGCSADLGGRSTVQNAGDDMLKLRAGPGLGYRIILGLPDGTQLNRSACVTEIGQLWCKVSLADAPQVKGYVSADYITVPW